MTVSSSLVEFAQTITLLNIGFSVIAALIVFFAYVLYIPSLNKRWQAITACAALLMGLCGLQLAHLQFLQTGAMPLLNSAYLFAIFFVPPNFYLFSRAILFSDRPFKLFHLLHFVPICLVFVAKQYPLVPLVAFILGAGYSVWLASVIYRLKAVRRGFKLEFFFFSLCAAVAFVVLMFGLFATYYQTSNFYFVYANGIALGFILVVATLLANPNAIENLAEAVKLSYANTTLGNVAVSAKLEQLTQLMEQKQLYQDENLSLAMLAQELGLSSHQLSELINTHFEMNFSRYIRKQRVEAAKRILTRDAQASILSISMEVGFKSQSNFYAAFKEVTGMSPGQFRSH
ncbi:helix-turn-helix domain-containing protein [Saccharophagus degradans]|uniref:AraC family transcriptional regulator n=1 Tax=Saccharophagus degradans TaxID=86304 RepID=UPI002477D815|nr:helix-turn-helix domain-containing protein [Saccharophagus degradans]WGO99536.1 helix-turn-helix domain-containing protein [Saccharophagus degradans]